MSLALNLKSDLTKLHQELTHSSLHVKFGRLGGRVFVKEGTNKEFSLREVVAHLKTLHRGAQEELVLTQQILGRIKQLDVESKKMLKKSSLFIRIATALKSFFSAFIFDWKKAFKEIEGDVDCLLSIDAESIGLYGEHYAVGYTVVNRKGREFTSGFMACPFDTAKGLKIDIEWSRKNILPSVPLNLTHKNPEELYEAVYQLLIDLRKKFGEGLKVVADYGYPVETGLFAKAIQLKEEERRYRGPFPIYEVTTALEVAGIDRGNYPPLDSEKPLHHPVNDARYSARLFLLALAKTQNLRPI